MGFYDVNSDGISVDPLAYFFSPLIYPIKPLFTPELFDRLRPLFSAITVGITHHDAFIRRLLITISVCNKKKVSGGQGRCPWNLGL